MDRRNSKTFMEYRLVYSTAKILQFTTWAETVVHLQQRNNSL